MSSVEWKYTRPKTEALLGLGDLSRLGHPVEDLERLPAGLVVDH